MHPSQIIVSKPKSDRRRKKVKRKPSRPPSADGDGSESAPIETNEQLQPPDIHPGDDNMSTTTTQPTTAVHQGQIAETPLLTRELPSHTLVKRVSKRLVVLESRRKLRVWVRRLFWSAMVVLLVWGLWAYFRDRLTINFDWILEKIQQKISQGGQPDT